MEEKVTAVGQKPLTESVYRRVLEMLIQLELAPGSKIGVDSLARRLGVSHTPVREALYRLEMEGLVARSHLRGFSVVDFLSREELDELYELRLLLEPLAAARAAGQRSQADLDRLSSTVEDMVRISRLPEGREKNAAMALSDAQFHDGIAVACGNRFMARALTRLHIHLQIFRQGLHQDLAPDATREHVEIFGAIRDSDPEKAQLLMKSHLDESWRHFVEAAKRSVDQTIG